MRSVLVFCLLVAAALAPGSAAAVLYTAPGRTVIDIGAPAPDRGADIASAQGGPSAAVALPDGGAVIAATEIQNAGVLAVRIRGDGSLDPSFGAAGVAHIRVEGGFSTTQVLRQADGRLLFAGNSSAAKEELAGLVLVRVNTDGSLDTSFGQSGIARTGIHSFCDICGAVALQPDDSIVATGNAGAIPPRAKYDPAATGTWVVIRLTPAGTPDPAFGTGGSAEVTGPGTRDSAGYAVQPGPDGRLVVLGLNDFGYLTALTREGAPDRTFNGGTPVPVQRRSINVLLRSGGSVDVFESGGTLARFTPAGQPDTAFGEMGNATIASGDASRLLSAPRDGSIAYALGSGPPFADPVLDLWRVDGNGHVDAVVHAPAEFGGGYASLARDVEPPLKGLAQNGFTPVVMVRRPDGSHLVVGSVRIVQPLAEGAAFSSTYVATEALDATFAPVATYGSPSTHATSSVHVPAQRARSDARAQRVLVRVTTSQPGLMLLRVRDGHRRLLAQTVAPIYTSGTAAIHIPLTDTGRTVLRRAHGIRVLVGTAFRSVTTAVDGRQTVARLR